MARVTWRGKPKLNRSVGKGKHFDHTTIQAALDYIDGIGDAAEDNQYLVDVAPGEYLDADGQVDDDLSHVSVIGHDKHTCILRLEDSALAGGTYRIAAGALNSSNTVEVLNKTVLGATQQFFERVTGAVTLREKPTVDASAPPDMLEQHPTTGAHEMHQNM